MRGRSIGHDTVNACGNSSDRLAFAATEKANVRENDMRGWLAGLILLIAPSAFAQQPVPAIAFDSLPNPLKLPPNMYFGEVSGVSVNSKGHVFALSRGNTTGPAYAAAATQLLEFDAQGKFIREIGKGLYAWSYGHTVRIDPQDNIWVTDKGSDMVVKFNPRGRVLMVFGRKQEASDKETGPLERHKPPLAPDIGRFRQVTDVAWDPQGNTYISDGYLNSRVAKVEKLQAARLSLTLAPGAPWAVCITPGPNQVLFASDAYPGRVYKLSLEGKVLGWLGESGKQLKQFGWIHEIACPSEKLLYVAELLNWRVQKLILKQGA